MWETLYLKTETVFMDGVEYWRQTLVERQGLRVVATCQVEKVGSCHKVKDEIDVTRDMYMGPGVADGCVVEMKVGLLKRFHDYCHELKTYHGV